MIEVISFDKAMLSVVLTENHWWNHFLDKIKYVLKDIFLTVTVESTFKLFLFPNKSTLQKILPGLN